MSKLSGVLELAVPADAARAACLRALAELGWHAEATATGSIRGHEEPCELPCHLTPASADLRIRGDAESSAVTIETRVPGIGPISSTHARARQEALVRGVHRAAGESRSLLRLGRSRATERTNR